MPNKDDIIKQLSEENAALRKEIKKATKTSELLGVFKRAVKRNLHEFFVREDKIKNILQENQRLQKELEKKEDELNREKAANIFLATENEMQKDNKVADTPTCNYNSADADESLLPQNKEEAINKYFSSINLTETIKNMPLAAPATNSSTTESVMLKDNTAVDKNSTTQKLNDKSRTENHQQEGISPFKSAQTHEEILAIPSENVNKNKTIVEPVKKPNIKAKRDINKNESINISVKEKGKEKIQISSQQSKYITNSLTSIKEDKPKHNANAETQAISNVDESFMQPVTFDIKLDQEVIPDVEIPDIDNLSELDDIMKDEKRIWDDDDI